MKRDFWSGNHPLGHVTLLALSEDFWMTALPRLYAKGYSSLDGVTPMYLWALGSSYKYEIEVRKNSYYAECDVFEASYEEAMEKFEKMVDKVELLWYNELTWEDY